MDRVASLLVTASDLRRKLFASLPWGYRLATVFMAMDAGSIESWGRAIGSYMLAAGIEGMPDPGPKWNPEKPNPSNLPRGYLGDFAKKAYAMALRATQNPEDASDVLMDVMMAYASGKTKFKAMPMKSAMSFVLKAVDWASGAIRKKRKPGVSLTRDDDEGGETTLDLVDDAFQANPHWNENPRQFKELAEAFPPEVWEHEVVPALRREHPDMPLFFDLLGDGNTAKDIVENGMLPHFAPSDYKTPAATWNAKVQKVKKVLQDIAKRAD